MNNVICLFCRVAITERFHDVSVCLVELRAMEACEGVETAQDAYRRQIPDEWRDWLIDGKLP